MLRPKNAAQSENVHDFFVDTDIDCGRMDDVDPRQIQPELALSTTYKDIGHVFTESLHFEKDHSLGEYKHDLCNGSTPKNRRQDNCPRQSTIASEEERWKT